MDVVAIGMVSALGYDVHTACAAARAGVTRAGELPFVVLENDKSPGVAVGHAAQLLTNGFDADARLARLLSGALSDLVSHLGVTALAGPKVGYYLSIPAADRTWQGLNLIATDGGRSEYLERVGPPPVPDEGARGYRLLEQAMRMARLPADVRAGARTLRVSAAGHAAVTALFSRAERDLAAGTIDIGVVGGVDSLVSPDVLPWLSLTGRLKCAEAPAGLAPGEAAAFVAVSRAGAPGLADAPALAALGHAVTRSSTTQLLAGEPADGRAQCDIISELGAVLRRRQVPWIVSDQNGELFRAADWGTSLVRLRGAGLTVGDGADLWHPAASFGDVGAATGVVAACVVVEAFSRGYARDAHACLLASSDGPARGGCVMSAAREN